MKPKDLNHTHTKISTTRTQSAWPSSIHTSHSNLGLKHIDDSQWSRNTILELCHICYRLFEIIYRMLNYKKRHLTYRRVIIAFRYRYRYNYSVFLVVYFYNIQKFRELQNAPRAVPVFKKEKSTKITYSPLWHKGSEPWQCGLLGVVLVQNSSCHASNFILWICPLNDWKGHGCLSDHFLPFLLSSTFSYFLL